MQGGQGVVPLYPRLTLKALKASRLKPLPRKATNDLCRDTTLCVGLEPFRANLGLGLARI